MVKTRMIIRKKSKSKSRFCGNCHYHNMYEYPVLIFCSLRYQNSNDFIVPTLGCCEKWTPDSQECFCVEEAMKKRNKNSVEHCKK
ncbi:MAG: hypothetical protein OEX06_05610 [Candidatus Bathyarchaeota archaeon]|nr:hypothetical protein [Candidatus Bathyarchaeota archaeon]